MAGGRMEGGPGTESEDSARPSVRQSVFASMEIFHLSDTHACPLRSGAALQLYAYLRVAI